jgi:hypothetical protein
MRNPSLWRDLVIDVGGVSVCTALRLLLWHEFGYVHLLLP